MLFWVFLVVLGISRLFCVFYQYSRYFMVNLSISWSFTHDFTSLFWVFPGISGFSLLFYVFSGCSGYSVVLMVYLAFSEYLIVIQDISWFFWVFHSYSG